MNASLPPPTPVPPPPPSPVASSYVTGRRPAPGLATASLVCGIVGLFGFFVAVPSIVALVLGLISWRRARAAPGVGDGRGQALAGWILGLVGVLGFVAFVIGAIATNGYEDDSTAIDDVHVGQCVDLELDAGTLTNLHRRDCDRPHDAEVYLVGRVDGLDEFPGDEALISRGRGECAGGALERYIGPKYRDASLDWSYVVPSEETWHDGDRTIVCLVTGSNDNKLTSSVAAG